MKVVKRITTSARLLVMIATVSIMAITVVDVVLRKFFSSPIMGVPEYSQMLMVVILLGAASTGMNDGHIKIDILYNIFPKKMKAVCDMVTTGLSFAISLIIATRSLLEGVDAYGRGIYFLTVRVLRAPFYFVYSAAFLILCMALVVLFIEAARRAKK